MEHLMVGGGSLLAAYFFGTLGMTLARRSASPSVRLPAIAFAVAWGAFAFIALNDALRLGVGTTESIGDSVYFALARLKILASAIVIWGLGAYVAYLWTGHIRHWNIILTLFAFSHAFLFLFLLERRDPVGVEVGTWATRMVFANEPSSGGVLALPLLLYFFLPPIVLAVAYLLLTRRLAGRTQRYRVLSVGLAIAIFYIANTVQSNPEFSSESPLWPALITLNVIAGLLAYVAYRPPAVIQRIFHVEGLNATPSTERSGTSDRSWAANGR